jgi:hypothetical protein
VVEFHVVVVDDGGGDFDVVVVDEQIRMLH